MLETVYQPKLIDTKEVAKRWQCCLETVKRKARRGELPCSRRLGHGYRFRLSDIRAYEQREIEREQKAKGGCK